MPTKLLFKGVMTFICTQRSINYSESLGSP